MTEHHLDHALHRCLSAAPRDPRLCEGEPRRHTVLLVDDEPHVLAGLRRVLHKDPYTLLCASSVQEAFGYLRAQTVDAVITDQDMPGMRGTVFLATLCREFPETVRFMLTGKPTLEVAMQAINDGAIHRFFTKPCNDADLRMTLRQALQQHDLVVAARHLLQRVRGQSAALAQLEEAYPGITHVRRDRRDVIVADLDTLTVDELIAQLRQEASTVTAWCGADEAPPWGAR
jgi:two-component system, probable response regulator PhcQ